MPDGSTPLDTAEHIDLWLEDQGPSGNPNLAFVLDDAARTITSLRADGKTVLLHCVEGSSRTPTVAALYSRYLGKEPNDIRTSMPWSKPNLELWKSAKAIKIWTTRGRSRTGASPGP